MKKVKTWIQTRRKGFTLVETIACCLILAIVTIGAASVSAHISALKVEARNSVYLTTHNLNVMERLRQMSYSLAEGEELLNFYGGTLDMLGNRGGNPVFDSSDIYTDVYIETAPWDDFRVYNVRIDSRMVKYKQTLVSTYTMTNIGGYKTPESIEDSDEGSVVLP